ncbi:pectate lyase [Streptomyces sp. DSM 44915]|uniref:Pectate lyase n=1 Tax=Streptomyces chisholmiae TaxID=3075540 RepID=A0ABU2JYB1_9ACTN|nr:pectate lyase [Streptomyces sp. DSM 44915]MDT0269982.1 pectate lyase [Streptomyces sp. DSM 44915]
MGHARTAPRLAALPLLLALLAAAAPPAGDGPPPDPAAGAGPLGWAAVGEGTTGGAGAGQDSTHVVRTRAELVAALDNGGRRAEPKIIHVVGDIDGAETDTGDLLGEQDYAPGWDLARYQACFGEDGAEWRDDRHPWCDEQRRLRTTGSNAQKRQIQLDVPSNTTLLGEDGARLLGVYLSVRSSENIVLRDLHLEAPVDYFPSWDPWDGADGAWNARFDAFSAVTGSRIWIDHCTFTDGRFPNSEAPEGFHGEPVERHDGLLDLEDGTDLVTVSYSRFVDHAKTALLGSGDGKGDRDRGRLRVTFHHNLFDDSAQRSPRVRFGRVHAFNNYFTGSTDDPDYPMRSEELGGGDYFLGMGLESLLVSEFNAFEYDGPGASPDILVSALGGHRFLDRGSWYGGQPVDLNALAEGKFTVAAAAAREAAAEQGVEPPAWALEEFSTDVGWSPAAEYPYVDAVLRSPDAVRAAVLSEAGPGRR